jgi:hypothetical protein
MASDDSVYAKVDENESLAGVNDSIGMKLKRDLTVC